MTKKAFRGFIAVLIVVVLLAVGWLIGWGITGNLNPVDWGKNQTQPEKENETVVGSIIGENINKYAKFTSARTSAVENRGNSTIDFGTLVGDRADIYIKDDGSFDLESFKVVNGFIQSYPMQSLADGLAVEEINMVIHGAYQSGPNSWSDASHTEQNSYYVTVYASRIEDGQIKVSGTDKIGVVVRTRFSLPNSSFAYYRDNSVLTSVKLFGLTPTYIYEDCVVFLDTYTNFLSADNNTPLLFEYTRAVSLPADPVKDGYTFKGWYYDSDFNTPYVGEPIYFDTQLYAKFEINKFTVTFNSNGGSSVASQTVNWNTSATLSTPIRTGYTFKGWYLPDGTQYINQTIKENIALSAHWEVIMCTVTFYVDGEVYETKSVEYGTSFADLLEYANKQNLKVSLISSLDGEIIDDYSAVLISENYSVVAEQMQGQEKFFNVLKNYWQYIVAGVGVLAVACGVIGVAVSKRKN